MFQYCLYWFYIDFLTFIHSFMNARSFGSFIQCQLALSPYSQAINNLERKTNKTYLHIKKLC